MKFIKIKLSKETWATIISSRLCRCARREAARKVKAAEAVQDPHLTEIGIVPIGNYADKSESVDTKDDKTEEAVIVEET